MNILALIITVDLNAKHLFFGSKGINDRGESLFDFVEQHDSLVCNNPNQPTRFDLLRGTSDLLPSVVGASSRTTHRSTDSKNQRYISDRFGVADRMMKSEKRWSISDEIFS